MVTYGAMLSPAGKGIPEGSLASKRSVKNSDEFSEMFLAVYTTGVRAFWCARVSSWEDRALKGNAGHSNNSHGKSARKTGAGTK